MFGARGRQHLFCLGLHRGDLGERGGGPRQHTAFLLRRSRAPEDSRGYRGIKPEKAIPLLTASAHDGRPCTQVFCSLS